MQIASDTVSLEDLESAARDRWEVNWSLKMTKYADGTIDAHVIHSNGIVDGEDDDRIIEHERLMPTADGEIVHDTVRFVPRRQVD